MTVRIEQSGTRGLTFNVAGAFDAADAAAIREALESADPNVCVRIDFHRARRCEPLALALLSTDIVARPGRIVLLGMCLHDRRLLGYFGLSERDFASHVLARASWSRAADTLIE